MGAVTKYTYQITFDRPYLSLSCLGRSHQVTHPAKSVKDIIREWPYWSNYSLRGGTGETKNSLLKKRQLFTVVVDENMWLSIIPLSATWSAVQLKTKQ